MQGDGSDHPGVDMIPPVLRTIYRIFSSWIHADIRVGFSRVIRIYILMAFDIKAIITIGCDFIGMHLAEQLLNEGKIHGIDNYSGVHLKIFEKASLFHVGDAKSSFLKCKFKVLTKNIY